MPGNHPAIITLSRHPAARLAGGLLSLILPGVAEAAMDAQTSRKLAGVGIPFVSNAGQWDGEAAFAARTFAGTLFVTGTGRLVYAGTAAGKRSGAGIHGGAVTETLVDHRLQARPAVPRGRDAHAARISYFVGNDPGRHRAGLPAFGRIDLGEVYPGVNVQLRATGSNVEKIFTVTPGQEPRQIRLRVDGVRGSGGAGGILELGDDGELVAQSAAGPIRWSAPIAFQQDADGVRQSVAVRYELAAGSNAYGFAVGDYDKSRPLVIDPLLSSTYLGGTASDAVTAIAINSTSDGSIYVAGNTTSGDFPATAGSAQPGHAADSATENDAFVARFSPDLATLMAATYFGGNGDDTVTAMAFTSLGTILIAGTTTSTNLPGSAAGALPSAPASFGTNSYVAQFGGSLNSLLNTTYFGGLATTTISAIAQGSNAIYVAGTTAAGNLPSTAGAAQPLKSGGTDAFVSRLSTGLETISRTTYFGGSGDELGRDIALHPQSGDLYIVGESDSTTIPGVAGGAYPAKAGGADGFIARIAPDLSTIRQSTFYGGTARDQFEAMAIHPLTGEIYAAGFTFSSALPMTANGAQAARGGGGIDGFVVRVQDDLRLVANATFFGGSGASVAEQGFSLAIHPVSGEVYLAGRTDSTILPSTAGAIQGTRNGSVDGFVTRFHADLTDFSQTTFFGGNSLTYINAIAIHPFNFRVVVAGRSLSDIPYLGGAFPTSAGGTDEGFVALFTPDLTASDKTPTTFGFPPKFGALPGATVRSTPVLLSGFTSPAAAYLTGGSGARYCFSTAADCKCDVQAFTAASSFVDPGTYVCMRDIAGALPSQTVVSTLHVGGGAGIFLVTTGNAQAAPCSLDVDGNGVQDALTDGLIILRALFGLTGTAVTSGAIGPGAARTTWAQLQPFLNTNCAAAFAP